jgi:pimeloyl-ACP methyl ester carboxylesterase
MLMSERLPTPEGPGAGHWVAEQAPEEMLAALTAFLATYRVGALT